MLEPIAMRCVPIREACSAIVMVEESEVGGLGGGGIMDWRLEDIVIAGLVCCFADERSG